MTHGLLLPSSTAERVAELLAEHRVPSIEVGALAVADFFSLHLPRHKHPIHPETLGPYLSEHLASCCAPLASVTAARRALVDYAASLVVRASLRPPLAARRFERFRPDRFLLLVPLRDAPQPAASRRTCGSTRGGEVRAGDRSSSWPSRSWRRWAGTAPGLRTR